MKFIEKQSLLATFAVTVSLLMTGCDRHQKSERYFLIATNIGLTYWQSAHEGFDRAAAQYGVTAEMRGPDTFNPAVEVDEFRAAVARKPAGILVSVADPQWMTPAINEAIAAGIPVITIDADAPESQRLYFIGTNNLEAGRLGGERVAAELNGKGNVAFFTMPGQANLEERLKGYKDVFANFPGIKIVEVFDMKGESGTAMDKAVEIPRPQRAGQGKRAHLPGGFRRQRCCRGPQALQAREHHADGDGRGPGNPATGERWHDSSHHLSKAVHHGFAGAESPG